MSAKNLCIGVDLGGTKIDVGLVDLKDGHLLERLQEPTAAPEGAKAVIKRIVALITKAQKSQKAAAVGIGVPGFIDYEKNLVIDAPHLDGFKDLPLKEILAKETGLPVSMDNDADCFTWGEYKLGAAEGLKHVVGMTIGTGIGGGIIINGQMYHGAFGIASEIGHMIVSSGRRPGFMGIPGMLDVYGSARGLIRTYEEFSGKTATPEEIQKLTEKKDAAAIKATLRTGHYLAAGFHNIAVTLNPEMIVLGGGLAQFKMLVDHAIQKFQQNTLPTLAKTKIVKGQLGRDGGIIGAALITGNN